MTPCDLHVLNTPPAFVLSQNQTLRIKTVWRILFPKDAFSKLTWRGAFLRLRRLVSPPSARPPPLPGKRARSAQFNLLPFPAFFRWDGPATGFSNRSGTPRAGNHAVKDPPFEGTKKPTGVRNLAVPPRSTCQSLGRPRSWRPAKLRPRSNHRQSIFSPFRKFFLRNGSAGRFCGGCGARFRRQAPMSRTLPATDEVHALGH
jgi:hypothetical protein